MKSSGFRGDAIFFFLSMSLGEERVPLRGVALDLEGVALEEGVVLEGVTLGVALEGVALEGVDFVGVVFFGEGTGLEGEPLTWTFSIISFSFLAGGREEDTYKH